MVLQSHAHPLTSSLPRTRPRPNLQNFPRKFSKPTCFVNLGLEDIAQIAHNKVLVAATLSAAIGQLSKPFTSVLLYGKDLDFRNTVQAGGFPSTHSSSVVAAATSLALERGFSDSIFGLTVVYAGLVMYDAQGVRREVGNHARVLNKLLPKSQVDTDVPRNRNEGKPSNTNLRTVDSFFRKEPSTLAAKTMNSPLLLQSDRKVKQLEGSKSCANDLLPLKESIGHTEVEVVAGALLGFIVSLAVYTLI